MENNQNGHNNHQYDRVEDKFDELEEIKYGGYTLRELKELPLEDLAPIALRSSNILLSGPKRDSTHLKLNPPLMVYIFKLIEKGLTQEDAARLAGVSQRIIALWRSTGKKLEALSEMGEIDLSDCSLREQYCYLFYIGTEQASANRKLKLLGKIENASDDPKFWTAAAWMLERQHPNEFGQRLRVEQVDWRSEVIGLIKTGVAYEVIADGIGEEEARRLFESANVTIDAPRLSEGNSPEG